jgi:hypothetical protein
MPEGAVRSKLEACRDYGAEVVVHGSHVGEMFAEQERLSAERGLTFMHPFDDPELIAGHGSAGLEIVEDLPDVDVVVVAIGGGGLISGVATAVREVRPATRVYGIEPEGANAMRLALDNGAPSRSPQDRRRRPDRAVRRRLDARRVPALPRGRHRDRRRDDPRRAALRRRADEAGPRAGRAAALAAVLYGKVPIRDGETVCVVASGGNVEVSRIGSCSRRPRRCRGGASGDGTGRGSGSGRDAAGRARAAGGRSVAGRRSAGRRHAADLRSAAGPRTQRPDRRVGRRRPRGPLVRNRRAAGGRRRRSRPPSRRSSRRPFTSRSPRPGRRASARP